MTCSIWLDIFITGAVFTCALFMWLGRDTRCNHEDEHSDVDECGKIID